MIAKLVQELYAERPKQALYHYTSLDGVRGIVDTGSLRATEIRYFSDAAEMKHAVDRLIPEIWFREGFGRSNPKLLSQLREWLSHRLIAGHMLYVGCFTSNGNLLSQWRSYCPKAKGVSLGFDQTKLSAAATRQHWRVGKCIYDPEEQEVIVTKILDEIERLAEKRGENTDPSKRHPSNAFHDIFEEIETDLLHMAALLKHPAFHEEQEWRLVSPVVTNYVEASIEYREGSSMLVPFMNFRLPEASDRRIDMEHVILGPTPNPNISMESLSNYLSKNGASPRQGLAYCQIPYRPW
ncbi:MAG: DUF2971 domain-containing protein [Nitrospira sp.]